MTTEQAAQLIQDRRDTLADREREARERGRAAEAQHLDTSDYQEFKRARATMGNVTTDRPLEQQDFRSFARSRERQIQEIENA